MYIVIVELVPSDDLICGGDVIQFRSLLIVFLIQGFPFWYFQQLSLLVRCRSKVILWRRHFLKSIDVGSRRGVLRHFNEALAILVT